MSNLTVDASWGDGERAILEAFGSSDLEDALVIRVFLSAEFIILKPMED